MRKGFTLIEILIVIALIGILASAISYFTYDSRIPQTNAERLANKIQDTIKNARNNMLLGRGIYSGSQLIPTDQRIISIKGGEITTTFAYNNTATGVENSLKYPFYDNDGQYQIADISVSSGIVINNYSMTWDHTGITDALITVESNGDLDIRAIKGGSPIMIPINTIRITAGYQGFEGSVILDRLTGRSEVLKGREGTDNPLLSPLNGACDNTTQYACTVGTSSANNPGVCDGSSTWNCTGAGGGSTQSCSKSNPNCPINGSCDNTTQYACARGVPSSMSGNYTGPTCGGNSTWTCRGEFGGTDDISCSKSNPNCPINGVCGGSNNTCSTGSPSGFSAGTCDGSSSWTCSGIDGGVNVSCGISNPNCINGSCNTPFNAATTPAPTCATGIPTTVNGSGPWTWGCNSTNGGTNTTPNACSAIITRNCSYNTYQGGSCNASCGGGNHDVYYNITVPASGSGTCTVSQGLFAGYIGGSCNNHTCVTSGPYTYGSWSGCSGACGTNNGTQSRSEYCNYTSCHSAQDTTQSCTASICACIPDGSCSASNPACGNTTYGVDNCGISCSLSGPICCASNTGDACMKSGTVNTFWYCGNIRTVYNNGTIDLCGWNGYCGSTVLDMGSWDIDGIGCSARAALASECKGTLVCSYSGLVPGTISCDGSCQ
ncbi:prepilin-type N-terminal cleavage/methylation domain-containing protein [Candidatus Gracilibacteria bacterium]|nr:prepilin-type N-terminal cleavage/methylation domain-containing protein [Candidatus Gracilibacteria bacterium]